MKTCRKTKLLFLSRFEGVFVTLAADSDHIFIQPPPSSSSSASSSMFSDQCRCGAPLQ